MKLRIKVPSVFKTLFWSIAASIMGYVINLLVAPYITEQMGIEAYGFVTLTKTFVDCGALITTALNSYAVRYIGMEYHKGNFEKANKYYSSVLVADVFLGILMIIFALVFSINVGEFLNVPLNLIKDVQRLFVLSFLNFAINTMMTVFSASAYLKNKLDLNYMFRTIGYVAEIASLMLLFFAFDTQLYYVGISYIINTIIILGSRIWMTRKWTPELHFEAQKFRINYVKELLINGIWNSINSLGNILNTSLDLLIANLMLSATELGQLGVVKTFPTMFAMLYQLVAQPFQPQLLKFYASNDKAGVKDTLQLAMKVSGFITYLVFGGFVAIGDDFYQLWMPNQDANTLYVLTILALLPNAMEGILYPCYYIYTLCVKNKIPCIVTIIGGIFNVATMFLLIENTALGVYAILITTIIVIAVVTYVTNPLYMAKCIGEKSTFFYATLLRGGICCLAMSIIMKFFADIVKPLSWMQLFGTVILLIIAGTIVYSSIMLDRQERNKIIDMLKNISPTNKCQ